MVGGITIHIPEVLPELRYLRLRLILILASKTRVNSVDERGRTSHLLKRHVTDPHPHRDSDPTREEVLHLESHGTVKAGIHVACSDMDKETESPNRASSLESPQIACSEAERLDCRGENEVTGSEDQTVTRIYGNVVEEMIDRLSDVDQKLWDDLRRSNDEKLVVERYIVARRLLVLSVVGINPDVVIRHLTSDVDITQDTQGHLPMMRIETIVDTIPVITLPRMTPNLNES